MIAHATPNGLRPHTTSGSRRIFPGLLAALATLETAAALAAEDFGDSTVIICQADEEIDRHLRACGFERLALDDSPEV